MRKKTVYLALGVQPDGTCNILGLWIENTEGAKFWMRVFNDLETRGLNDILIAGIDSLMKRYSCGLPPDVQLALNTEFLTDPTALTDATSSRKNAASRVILAASVDISP